MWFFFGFVTLVGSCAYMWRHRLDARWHGRPWNDCEYETTYSNKGKRLHTIHVAVPVTCLIEFELKPESWIDRVFKGVGQSVEAQVGSAHFDRALYIVAEDGRVSKTFADNAALAAQVLFLMRGDDYPGFRLKRLICRGGKLRIVVRAESFNPGHLGLIDRLSPRLHGVSKMLGSATTGPRREDRYFLRSVLVLATTSGLAINGVIHLLRISVDKTPFTVDIGQLWWLSALGGAAILTLLLAAVVVLLGRTSRAHLVLAEVLLVGSFGAITTSFAELRDLNMEADARPARVFVSTVMDKTVRRHRRFGRSYRMRVNAWDGESGSASIRISRSAYDVTSIGDTVQIRQHPGFFGVRWVESVDRVQPSQQ